MSRDEFIEELNNIFKRLFKVDPINIYEESKHFRYQDYVNTQVLIDFKTEIIYGKKIAYINFGNKTIYINPFAVVLNALSNANSRNLMNDMVFIIKHEILHFTLMHYNVYTELDHFSDDKNIIRESINYVGDSYINDIIMNEEIYAKDNDFYFADVIDCVYSVNSIDIEKMNKRNQFIKLITILVKNEEPYIRNWFKKALEDDKYPLTLIRGHNDSLNKINDESKYLKDPADNTLNYSYILYKHMNDNLDDKSDNTINGNVSGNDPLLDKVGDLFSDDENMTEEQKIKNDIVNNEYDDPCEITIGRETDNELDGRLQRILENYKNKNYGHMHGYYESVLEVLQNKRKIDWRKFIKEYSSRAMDTKFTTMKRFNKRYNTFPSYKHKISYDQINIFLDVSGSMPENKLSELLGEIKNLQYGTFVTFDTDICDIIKIERMKKKVTLSGRGGTVLDCVVDYCLKHKIKKPLIITDGYFGEYILSKMEKESIVPFFILTEDGAEDMFKHGNVRYSILK